MSNNIQSNRALKWLRRIFSLEFIGVCAALVSAYFAWIPIKSYFSNESPIEIQLGGKGITLSDDINKPDTIYIWALTHEKMKIQMGSLVLFNNKSNRIVKGLNVDMSFTTKNLSSIISPEWEFLSKGEFFEVRNLKQELRPSEKLFFPFNELMYSYSLDAKGNIINPNMYYFLASTQINYDGCKSPKFFSLFMVVSKLEHDSYNKIYGDTSESNRCGFNDDFLSHCLKHVKNKYELYPGEVDNYCILINLYDYHLLLNKDEVIRMCKERGID